MKKGALAFAVVASLALVGLDSSKAEAGGPVVVSVGGPRLQVTVVSGGGRGRQHYRGPRYGHYGRGQTQYFNYRYFEPRGYSSRYDQRRTRGFMHANGRY